MLPGSTSGLRSLCFQPSCKLLRSPARFANGRLTNPNFLPRSRISSAPYIPQNILLEQDGPESHESLAKDSCGWNARSPPSVSTGISRLGPSSLFSGIPTPCVDEKKVRQVVDADALSVIRDQPHGHVLHNYRPHRAPNHTKRKCPSQRRRTLLWVMLTTKSPDRAWAAHQELLSYQVVIPNHLLRRLVRHLASIKPRTRMVYLQLLSVLKYLQRNHGKLRLWEWNTLIDCVGKQWHKTRLEDYENSLDIFNKKGALPMGNVAGDSPTESYLTQQDPDLWTYNILLSIACRSALPLTVRHASSLLLASGLSPNRYTHLCLLRYFAVQKDLQSVRSTLRKMKLQGLELGLDGINACLWAYARNRRFDVALRIYRVLRSNVHPATSLEGHDIDDDSRYIRETVGVDNLGGFQPDKITYTMMIQALAYHGDLRNALSVFVDMLSTPNWEAGAQTNHSKVSPAYEPSMSAFRGLFLGFARHGQDPEHCVAEAEPVSVLFSTPQAVWDLDTLEAIFTAFLRLPSLPQPTDRLVYWILVAFDKTSGKDPVKLREVWMKLEAKYGGRWGGRLEVIKKSIFTLDDKNA